MPCAHPTALSVEQLAALQHELLEKYSMRERLLLLISPLTFVMSLRMLNPVSRPFFMPLAKTVHRW